ncbi:MAG: hypothetical protein PVJ92_00290 [Candidatus Dependentiae bacterium]|jgi:TPR repeat protein
MKLMHIVLIVGISLSAPTNRLAAASDDLEAVRARALGGDADAQFKLGVMYEFGRGVAECKTEAVKWWRMAADQGHRRTEWHLEKLQEKAPSSISFATARGTGASAKSMPTPAVTPRSTSTRGAGGGGRGG